jgi:hypothetical protein
MDLKRVLSRQENQMALFVAGVVFPVVATLAGFYMGTFFASEHITDLMMKDIRNGVAGAAIGFTVGVATFLFVLMTYPKVIEREYEAREAREQALREGAAHH